MLGNRKHSLSSVGNGDLAVLAFPGCRTLCGSHDAHASFHLPKGHVFTMQPLLGPCIAEAEMGIACVWSSICRGYDAKTHAGCFTVKCSSSKFSL